MDTVGSVLDKICILEKRMEVIKAKFIEEHKEELNSRDLADANHLNLKRHAEKMIEAELKPLKQQMGWLIYDMARTILEGYSNTRPLTFKKFKIYDSIIKKDKDTDLINAIAELREHNRNLWALEDERRDKRVTDEHRLKAADEVSVQNKKRNDTIDIIDEIVEDAIGSIK